MGRKAKVPVEGGKIVSTTQIGHGAGTPYDYEDVRWDVLRRLGFDGELPSYADDHGGQ